MSVSAEDIQKASELFDAAMAGQGAASFTPEQIREFQKLAEERDVIERARLCQLAGERILREAEESLRRYEEVRRQCEELGIDLEGRDLDGDAQRMRDRCAQEFLERVQREAAAEARRLFGAGEEESAARVMSRGAGRMRV